MQQKKHVKSDVILFIVYLLLFHDVSIIVCKITKSFLISCCRAAVVDAEGKGALEGFLDIGDDAHGGMFISLETNCEALGIIFREFFALGLDELGQVLDIGELVVHLNLPFADIDIDDGRLLLEFLYLGTGGHLIAHLHIVMTHVGDNHEKEQHGEDEVGHGGEIQAWHVVGTATEDGLHTSHDAPPSDGFDSLMRWG